MSIPGFGRINAENEEVRELQEAAARPLQALVRLPILDGHLLEGLDVTSTAADFEHGLGRRIRGAIVVMSSGNTDVRASEADDPTTYVTLDAGTSVTVSLWVF